MKDSTKLSHRRILKASVCLAAELAWLALPQALPMTVASLLPRPAFAAGGSAKDCNANLSNLSRAVHAAETDSTNQGTYQAQFAAMTACLLVQNQCATPGNLQSAFNIMFTTSTPSGFGPSTAYLAGRQIPLNANCTVANQTNPLPTVTGYPTPVISTPTVSGPGPVQVPAPTITTPYPPQVPPSTVNIPNQPMPTGGNPPGTSGISGRSPYEPTNGANLGYGGGGASPGFGNPSGSTPGGGSFASAGVPGYGNNQPGIGGSNAPGGSVMTPSNNAAYGVAAPINGSVGATGGANGALGGSGTPVYGTAEPLTGGGGYGQAGGGPGAGANGTAGPVPGGAGVGQPGGSPGGAGEGQTNNNTTNGGSYGLTQAQQNEILGDSFSGKLSGADPRLAGMTACGEGNPMGDLVDPCASDATAAASQLDPKTVEQAADLPPDQSSAQPTPIPVSAPVPPAPMEPPPTPAPDPTPPPSPPPAPAPEPAAPTAPYPVQPQSEPVATSDDSPSVTTGDVLDTLNAGLQIGSGLLSIFGGSRGGGGGFSVGKDLYQKLPKATSPTPQNNPADIRIDPAFLRNK